MDPAKSFEFNEKKDFSVVNKIVRTLAQFLKKKMQAADLTLRQSLPKR